MEKKEYDFGPEDRRFVSFEKKTIDEQADEITHSLLWEEEESRFEFDAEDRVEKREFQKAATGCGVTIVAVTAIDIKILNGLKWGKQMGPLRKFFLINLLNSPIYFYYYYSLTQNYMRL